MDLEFRQDNAMRRGKSLVIPKTLVITLAVIAVLIVGYFLVPCPISVRRNMFPFVAILTLVFAMLGVVLMVVAARMRGNRTLKIFLLVSGSSAAGVLLCAVLHNVVYGLMIHWFGAGIWDRLGLADEPVFFVLALFVCPTLFFVGEIGSVVLFLRKKMQPPMAASV